MKQKARPRSTNGFCVDRVVCFARLCGQTEKSQVRTCRASLVVCERSASTALTSQRHNYQGTPAMTDGDTDLTETVVKVCVKSSLHGEARTVLKLPTP